MICTAVMRKIQATWQRFLYFGVTGRAVWINVDNADKSTLIWYDSVSRLSVCDGWIGNTTASVQHPARFSMADAVWLWWWRGLSRQQVAVCFDVSLAARGSAMGCDRYTTIWCLLLSRTVTLPLVCLTIVDGHERKYLCIQ